jgi:hypothetical protein
MSWKLAALQFADEIPIISGCVAKVANMRQQRGLRLPSSAILLSPTFIYEFFPIHKLNGIIAMKSKIWSKRNRTLTVLGDMSKLSEALKACINASYARPGMVAAPKHIRLVYESIQREAKENQVGIPPWLAIAVSRVPVLKILTWYSSW